MSYRIKPYEFRYVGQGSNRQIYAIFRDHNHRPREVEVSEEIHMELTLLNRSVRNIESSEERHWVFSDISEEEMALQGAPTYPSAEDVVLSRQLRKQVRAAFLKIPPIQARRYLLAHEHGYTLAEIARIEHCSAQAVFYSLAAAEKNLQRILRNRLKNTPSKFGN